MRGEKRANGSQEASGMRATVLRLAMIQQRKMEGKYCSVETRGGRRDPGCAGGWMTEEREPERRRGRKGRRGQTTFKCFSIRERDGDFIKAQIPASSGERVRGRRPVPRSGGTGAAAAGAVWWESSALRVKRGERGRGWEQRKARNEERGLKSEREEERGREREGSLAGRISGRCEGDETKEARLGPKKDGLRETEKTR